MEPSFLVDDSILQDLTTGPEDKPLSLEQSFLHCAQLLATWFHHAAVSENDIDLDMRCLALTVKVTEAHFRNLWTTLDSQASMRQFVTMYMTRAFSKVPASCSEELASICAWLATIPETLAHAVVPLNKNFPKEKVPEGTQENVVATYQKHLRPFLLPHVDDIAVWDEVFSEEFDAVSPHRLMLLLKIVNLWFLPGLKAMAPAEQAERFNVFVPKDIVKAFQAVFSMTLMGTKEPSFLHEERKEVEPPTSCSSPMMSPASSPSLESIFSSEEASRQDRTQGDENEKELRHGTEMYCSIM